MLVAKVKWDSKEAEKELSLLVKEKVPLITARALTDVAKLAVYLVQAKTRATYKLHGDFIPQGVKYRSAEKRDFYKYGFCFSVVNTAPRISTFMPLHESGGAKVPRSKMTAIPGVGLQKRSFKFGSGKTKPQWTPRQLLSRPPLKKRRKKPLSPSRAFIVKNAVGDSFVVRRTSREKTSLETLYILKPKADIKPTWDFHTTVERSVNVQYEQAWKRNAVAAGWTP